MSKKAATWKMKRMPATYTYTCDTCGHEFAKGERKVTYYQGSETKHACYTKPCCPFSRPKDYVWRWDPEAQEATWQKLS